MQEIWKEVKGYEGLFEVSDLGNVASLDRVVPTNRGSRIYTGRILSLCNSAGYVKVHLTKNKVSKQIKVHQLVAIAFLDHIPKKGIVIDHKDNNRKNNKVSNLQIITHRQNIAKGYSVKNTSSKYTGVYYKGANQRGKDWRAMANIGKVRHSLGSFDLEEDAAKAYNNFINKIK